MRGKIKLFGLDALVNMAAAAGLVVPWQVRKPRISSRKAF
jgi:predicted XRE-type DNA-binding protein